MTEPEKKDPVAVGEQIHEELQALLDTTPIHVIREIFWAVWCTNGISEETDLHSMAQRVFELRGFAVPRQNVKLLMYWYMAQTPIGMKMRDMAEAEDEEQQ